MVRGRVTRFGNGFFLDLHTHTQQCSQSFVLVIVVDQKAVDQIFILVYTRALAFGRTSKKAARAGNLLGLRMAFSA